MKRLELATDIPALTGVRGLAAVWVVIFHAYPSFSGAFGLPIFESVPFIFNGFLGVDLFFLLSGFIMHHVHGQEFAAYTWRNHKRFLMLRACRVYPLHLVCLAAFVAMIVCLPGIRELYKATDLTLPTLAATVFLVQNWGFGRFSLWNGPAWSLSAELLGYLVFPFIVLAINRTIRPSWNAFAIVCILSCLLALLYIAGYPTLNAVGKTGIVRMLSEFTAGCLLHRMLSHSPTKYSSETGFWISIAILAVSACFSQFNYLAVFGFVLLIASLARSTRSGNVVFANPLSMWLGNISFSLYLSHTPLLAFFEWQKKYVGDGWSPTLEKISAVSYFSLLLLLSFLLWRFVEMPSRSYLRRFVPARSVDTAHNPASTHLGMEILDRKSV